MTKQVTYSELHEAVLDKVGREQFGPSDAAPTNLQFAVIAELDKMLLGRIPGLTLDETSTYYHAGSDLSRAYHKAGLAEGKASADILAEQARAAIKSVLSEKLSRQLGD